MKKDGFENKSIDIIIPVGLDEEPDLQKSIGSIIELHRKAGFRKFALFGPSKGWRGVGYPPKECFEEIADRILEFKKGLRDTDILVGWWNTLTLKSGKYGSHRIVRIDGSESYFSNCPLAPAFQKRFSADVAFIAEKAAPYMIVFEDDYGINCHRGYGCFCELHLKEFARRTGKHYSREELREKLMDGTDEAVALRLKWGELSRDSLMELAAHVRKAVDRVTPWMPMGSMQPGCADADGDSTRAVAEALAGKNHRPFVRLHGTSYSNDDVSSAPQNIFHALYGRQHLPEKFILYHESDTYPHNRFFMSAGKMKTLMASAYSYAFDGSTFQVRQHLDDPNEDPGYYEMFARECRRLNALRDAAKKCTVSGCGLISSPMGFSRNENWENGWVRAFAHFGIPYTTLESRVNVLSGKLPNALDDETIRRLLRKGLLLDGEAAKLLCDRGFAPEIGAEVTEAPEKTYSKIAADICGKERIRDAFIHGNTGRLMDGCFTFSPYGNGSFQQLKPLSSKTEAVTELLDFRDHPFGIGMTRFENSLGGRVVLLAQGVKNNLSSSLFNYRRQRLIQELVVWLGAEEIVYVKECARVFCILNRPTEKFDHEFYGVVTLIDLSPDPLESVELRIPADWCGKCKIELLDIDGKWKKASFEFGEGSVKILHPMTICEPLYLAFRKK
ncbi:MAG: hypothetical protein BWY31_02620 [Lentisphaerae bacterium ADurb.Bin242]|nr:MAG: hypothetical protein BWY31_02620 [Lentisphaerae bacterium ADurb.Bin242]